MFDIDARLARELHAAKLAIEDLAVELCSDPVVFKHHNVALQRFDYLAQIIGEVAHVLNSRQSCTGVSHAIRLEAMLGRLEDDLS
ncbi:MULTISPECIES: hypothetical protein [unclassified Sphingomonas]|uniref:hypothetical protein n=1 Tax=unclassified Sphingomonas TaxID=196159 RepID=UPI002269FD66|nr:MULTISPECIES: hypothetical protein [unclassified Sphingomonas]